MIRTKEYTRITGGPIRVENVIVPEKYKAFLPGDVFAPGRIGMGPLAYNETTVCLIEGDDGKWFTDQIEKAGGHWTAYTYSPDWEDLQ